MPQEQETTQADKTSEIVRDKTMLMTQDVRTGLYTVVSEPLNGSISVSSSAASSSVPSAEKHLARIKKKSNRNKHTIFRRIKGDVDSLISEQFISEPKKVEYSTVENFEKSTFLEDSYVSGPVFAEGGQGILRTAIDRELHRTAAVKTLKHSDDPEKLKSFLREAKVTAQLDHPAILPIYSLNTDADKSAHLVMRYIKGCTLKEYLERIDSFYRIDGVKSFDERKSLFNRLDLFLRVCDAMEFAHKRNIMHRDLKPENIMIGEYHDVYIMDWGIACPIYEDGYDPEKWVPPKTVMGTPRYISPEALRGEHCDQRADIYALGLILYEIVTLNEAYTGVTGEEVMQRVAQCDMNLLEHRYGVPIDDDLFAIIMKATEPQQNDRYSTVAAFADDIRRYMRNEEVKANPDTILSQIMRWCSRHPRLIAGITVGIILFFILVGAGLIIRRVAIDKERETVSNVVNQAFARNLYIAGKLEWMLASKIVVPAQHQEDGHTNYTLSAEQQVMLAKRIAQVKFLTKSLVGQYIYSYHDNKKILNLSHTDELPQQLRNEFRCYGNGTYISEKDGKYYLWCYSRVSGVKWVYLECFSLEMLRVEQLKTKKARRNSGNVMYNTKFAALPF